MALPTSEHGLAPGFHFPTQEEFFAQFGVGEHRVELLHHFHELLQVFRPLRVNTLWVGAEIVSSQPDPGLVRAAWNLDEAWFPIRAVDIDLLDLLCDPEATKHDYLTDLRALAFPDDLENDPVIFDLRWSTGNELGIVVLELEV